MKIVLNGESKQLPEDTHVEELVKILALENQRIAIEINQQIIPRSQYSQHPLKQNDQIEIVRALGGG